MTRLLFRRRFNNWDLPVMAITYRLVDHQQWFAALMVFLFGMLISASGEATLRNRGELA